MACSCTGACPSAAPSEGASANFSCSLKNSGRVAGDEVVLVYHKAGASMRKALQQSHPVPLKALVEFARVRLAPGTRAGTTMPLAG